MIVVTDHSDYNHTENLIYGDTATCGACEKSKIRRAALVDTADPDSIGLCSCRNYDVLWSGSPN